MAITVRPHPRVADRWTVCSSHFSPKLREAAWSVPGMKFDYDVGAWVGYPDAVELCLKKLDELGLRYDDGSFNPEELLARSCGESPLPVSYEGLRGYQKTGVDFLLEHSSSGALLADSPRLGKSAMSLRAARALRQKTLIICPSHVVGVWARSNPEATPPRPCEIEKWWPDAYKQGVYICEGTRPDESKIPLSSFRGQVVVIHYDILYAWVEALIAWGYRTLIVDEIHLWQSSGSRRSQAGFALRQQATSVMALSGTPMVNRPRDLYSVCEILSPGRFGDNPFAFFKKYCGAHQETVGRGENLKTVWNFDGSSNEEELHRRLSFFMLRRTKSEVAEQLPKETRQVVELTVPRKFNLPALLSLQSKQAARRALDLAADGALPQVLKILEEDCREGIKQVAFCFRRAVAEHLFQELSRKNLPCELIHGLIPARKRDQRIQKAREASGAHVLVVTIDSCSTGIDLSYASTATFVELPWELVDLLQAKERLYNMEQMTPISIRLLCVRGTAQELILEELLNKLQKFESIVGSVGDDKLKTDLLGQSTGEDALNDLCQEILQRQSRKDKAKNGKRKGSDHVSGKVSDGDVSEGKARAVGREEQKEQRPERSRQDGPARAAAARTARPNRDRREGARGGRIGPRAR